MRPPPRKALQMVDFASCIATGRETPVSGSMGREHPVVIGTVYKSAAEAASIGGNQAGVTRQP
jgi:hypothetical protein